MTNTANYIFKDIDDKTLVWVNKTNEYLILEPLTADILKHLEAQIPIAKIAETLSKALNIPIADTINFVTDFQTKITLKTNTNTSVTTKVDGKINKPTSYKHTRFFNINGIIFKVNFSTDLELLLIQPKFEHLEVTATKTEHYNFQVFTKKDIIYFYIDTILIGAWHTDNTHFFQGKFSMQIIQKIHQKEEDKWLGVFHASAVSNGKKAMLFLGDSGNGKSTSLALLQANGFTCLADDFVPVAAKKQDVYSFPAAISIKKNSVPVLIDTYPELAKAKEYHYQSFNKIVRYLAPKNTNYLTHLPCKDLVFIKYKKNSALAVSKISKTEAFQKLVPDAWLSPLGENAAIFLNWFATLNCYQITYSNNQEMIDSVSKLFKDDL